MDAYHSIGEVHGIPTRFGGPTFNSKINATTTYITLGMFTLATTCLFLIPLFARSWLCYCCNRRVRRYPFETVEHASMRRANIGLKKNDMQQIPTFVYCPQLVESEWMHMTYEKQINDGTRSVEDQNGNANDSNASQMANTRATCAICLVDFEDGHLIRILPTCMHAFHVPCIDAWLSKHSSCPTCRGDLMEAIAEKRSQEVHLHIIVEPSAGQIDSKIFNQDSISH